MSALSYPSGYHPEFLGEYAARQASRNRLVALGALALLGIFLILHADFGSARIALIVFASLPFALVGGVVAVLVSGGVLSLGSLVGFVIVLGGDKPGHEIQQPLAVVIIGGLVTSTLLNLFFMPAFYLRFMSETAGAGRSDVAPAIADR